MWKTSCTFHTEVELLRWSGEVGKCRWHGRMQEILWLSRKNRDSIHRQKEFKSQLCHSPDTGSLCPKFLLIKVNAQQPSQEDSCGHCYWWAHKLPINDADWPLSHLTPIKLIRLSAMNLVVPQHAQNLLLGSLEECFSWDGSWKHLAPQVHVLKEQSSDWLPLCQTGEGRKEV